MTNPCKQLRDAVEWRHPGNLPAPLQTHVMQCDDCKRYLHDWPIVEHELRDMLTLTELADASRKQQTAALLVARATASATHKTGWRMPVPILTGGIALASIVLVLIALYQTVHQAPPPPTGPALPVTVHYLGDGALPVNTAVRAGETVDTPHNTRSLMRISKDRIGIRAQSQVLVHHATSTEVMLRLKRGAVACDVAHRNGANHFIVESSGVRVTVVGTRFSVERQADAVVVAVKTGTVRVKHNGNQWSVSRGRQLRVPRRGAVSWEKLSPDDARDMDHLLSDPLIGLANPVPPAADEILPKKNNALANQPDAQSAAAPSTEVDRTGAHAKSVIPKNPIPLNTPQIDKWRRWIVSGKINAAETEILHHVRQSPNDIQAWALLSDCHRKAQKWTAAVADYRQLIRLSPPKERRRAQYRAAAILQDELADHSGAIALLEKYVSSAKADDALGAEARIRLARSYLKVGNRIKGETLLEYVISRYPGTPTAARARRMLDDM